MEEGERIIHGQASSSESFLGSWDLDQPMVGDWWEQVPSYSLVQTVVLSGYSTDQQAKEIYEFSRVLL